MKRIFALWAVAMIAATAFVISTASGCSISLVIWSIRSKPADPLFRFVRNGKTGFIDRRGVVVIPPTLLQTDNSLGEFHEGLLALDDKEGQEYIDRSGKVVFRTRWSSYGFAEGLAAVPNDLQEWGFIDHTGKFAIPPRYASVDSFSDGLALVSRAWSGADAGYIDHDGNTVIPTRLSYGHSFHEGFAAVVLDGPCQIINGGSCGPLEFRPMKNNPGYDCRFSFIDKTGKPISSLRFDIAGDFSEGLAPVGIGKKWGYIDKAGQFAIPAMFDYAGAFSDGLAAVLLDQKMGFIDHSGNFAIPPQFQTATDFSEGRSIVGEFKHGQRPLYRFIDKSGRPAFPGSFETASAFTYGLADVSLGNGHFAWINTSGRVVFRYSQKR